VAKPMTHKDLRVEESAKSSSIFRAADSAGSGEQAHAAPGALRLRAV
jgi:hypothetical protein